MEDLIIGKLLNLALGGDTPSGLALLCINIWVLVTLKKIKTKQDTTERKLNLIIKHLGLTNVVDLPNNASSKK